MNVFTVSNSVKRFPGQHGWYYIELDEDLAKGFRVIIKDIWPALLRTKLTLNKTVWESSIMPIKNDPLFIALPAKVRKSEGIEVGQTVTVQLEPKI